MKAERNKTIDMSMEEGTCYLDRCISVTKTECVEDILDKTVRGDAFEVLPYLPEKFVDLLIVDPPYNLDKDFHGKKFRKTTDEQYEEYTEAWIQAVLPLLKETATIYVCCDWFSSLSIGNVLKKYFHLQNRITWQREKGRGARSNWKNGMEDIWFATKSDTYTFNVEAVKIRIPILPISGMIFLFHTGPCRKIPHILPKSRKSCWPN